MQYTCDYSTIEKMLSKIKLPRMACVAQSFDDSKIENVEMHTAKLLQDSGMDKKVTAGMRIAVTAGSRGIDNYAIVVKEVVKYVKQCGGVPFIVPSMGSHGGATAQGQLEILKGYGITEESCDCEIISSMETIIAGYATNGRPVYLDKNAHEADGIILINRIKPHTAFRAPHESGLLKMLVVGLGKQKGAESIHNDGIGNFITNIPDYAKVVMDSHNILFGVGILENSFDKTARIEVVDSKDIFEQEAILLDVARNFMPRIMLDETEVLVVNEIGKNISGGGMDPNIGGRWPTPYASGGIKSDRIAVLSISPMSHGNFGGLGMADVTTKHAFETLDFAKTYPNFITNSVLHSCKIPMVMANDSQAIRLAIKACLGKDPENPRVIMIKNTLDISKIYVSENLLEEVAKNKYLELLSEPKDIEFDEEGNIVNMF